MIQFPLVPGRSIMLQRKANPHVDRGSSIRFSELSEREREREPTKLGRSEK